MQKSVDYWITLFAYIFVFTSASFAGTFSVFEPHNFTRDSGSPVTIIKSFSVFNPNADYTLKIYNGGLVDADLEKVSSSIIMMNGVQVVDPDEFSQNVDMLEKPVSLASHNELSVEVRGKPGGVITIEIIGVDNDPPTINAEVIPEPNAAGWNNRVSV